MKDAARNVIDFVILCVTLATLMFATVGALIFAVVAMFAALNPATGSMGFLSGYVGCVGAPALALYFAYLIRIVVEPPSKSKQLAPDQQKGRLKVHLAGLGTATALLWTLINDATILLKASAGLAGESMISAAIGWPGLVLLGLVAVTAFVLDRLAHVIVAARACLQVARTSGQ